MWGVASFLGVWIIVQSLDLIFKFIFGALIVGLGLGFFFPFVRDDDDELPFLSCTFDWAGIDLDIEGLLYKSMMRCECEYDTLISIFFLCLRIFC
jgi:hypothetical protein